MLASNTCNIKRQTSLSTNTATNLLDLSHDLIGISGAGGLHGPGEPQGPRLHLGGLVHHVGVGDVALPSRGEGAVHAHGVSLAPCTADTQTAVHTTVTRGDVRVSPHTIVRSVISEERLFEKLLNSQVFVITLNQV